MPTTLSPISNNSIKVRWKEPYASESLNRKFSGIIPAGVYRGLTLGVSSAPLSVDLLADTAAGDHVAVHENENGFSTTYSDNTSGAITVSLAAYATSDIVVLAIHISYTSGSATTAEFRGYSLAEYEGLSSSAKAGLVVLGTVLRPASGVIPLVNITNDRRTLPFANRSRGVVPWNPLIRNGGFELGDMNGTHRHSSPFWKTSTSNANFMVRPVATEARSGSKSLEITTSNVGTATVVVQQELWMPVVADRLVMVRLYKKSLQVATGSPTGRVRLIFGDLNGANDVQEDILFAVDLLDASFVELTGIVKVPSAARVLKSVQIVVSGTYSSAAPCIRFDDVQAWMESDSGNWLDVRDSRVAESAVGDLFLGAANSFGGSSAKLSFSGSVLSLDRRDESLSLEPPAISIQARTLGGIEYTLLLQSIPAGGKGYRKYMSATGMMIDVVNASYNNSTNLWSKDISGVTAFRQEARDTGFSSSSRVGDAPWVDASWIQHMSTSNSEVTTAANPKFAPMLMTRDAAGNRRVALDHLGLRGGRVTVLHQNWMPPMSTAWAANTNNSGTNTIINDDPVISGPAQKQYVDTADDRAGCYVDSIWKPASPSQIRVLEFELNCADLVGLLNLRYEAGFMHDEGGGPSPDNYLRISKTSSSANWFFESRGNATGMVAVDTGMAAGGFQRFRIEHYGGSTPGGERAMCYIDGLLVSELTTSMPDATQSMSLVFSLKATGVTSGKQVVLSPVTYTTTRYLSDDAI